MTNLIKLLALCCLLVACNQLTPGTTEIRVELVDGNIRSTYIHDEAVSVGEFLNEIQVEIGDLDRVEPRLFAQIEDGITITIVRVREDIVCREEEFAYDTRRLPSEALDPGIEQIAQAGENGIQRICERCIYENENPSTCVPNSETVIQDPKEEIIFFGTGSNDVPIIVEGKLAYIANEQAWIVEGNTRNRRQLTTDGRLDGRVFDLSADGRQLLYTRYTATEDDPDFTNELWAILDTGAPQPVRLLPDNVISGQWMPNEPFTISYSTAEPSDSFPGWDAFNDMYIMRIDTQTGETLSLNDIVRQNSIGLYTYWGTNYVWSPDGQSLAWSQADKVGLVDLDNGDFVTLLEFPHFEPAISDGWVWQPNISWSQDSETLITTVHGNPFGGEAAENSVVFDIAAVSPDRSLIIDDLIPRSGIWASPVYSPIRTDAAGFPDYQIAYLQSREPLNSLGGEYDLMVVDRDGSNPRVVFPPEGRIGLDPFEADVRDMFVWSPNGTHLAVIYQGNLWVIEVSTGLAQQVTIDGQASSPRWTD